jgi:tetraacyldisaccharide 4'-kinase
MEVVERYGIGFRLLRGAGGWALFYPVRVLLSVLYGMWLRARTGDAGRSRRGRGPRSAPRASVISVGNLEVGGGGKTPFTLSLAAEIRARGGRPVVVSRGYRSIAQRYAPCVVPSGAEVAEAGATHVTEEEVLKKTGVRSESMAEIAAVLGDEIMLYRKRGIPVVLDADRSRGAAVASELLRPTHILLDDAFQNRSIAKDVEIVLLDARLPFGRGRLLPLGTLRERPPAIGRADVVVFTRALEERVPKEAERFVTGKRVLFAAHRPVDLIGRTGEEVPLLYLAGRDCALFSGIARPESFEETIVSLGGRPRVVFRFVDHHRYTERDIGAMLRRAGEGKPFVTTEKDWVKARDLFPREVAVYALRIEMKVPGIEAVLDAPASSSRGDEPRSPDTR